jgi:regulatory protein
VAFQRRRFGTESSSDSEPARPLTPERLERRARNVLLYQLNRSIKSKKQLADILIQREIPDEIAHPLLDRFEDAGLINDATFAEAVVSSRTNTKGLSKSAIQRELRQKGVDEEIVLNSTAELDSEADFTRALGLASRRLRSMAALQPEVRKRRLVGYLQRKGYSSAVVFGAIKQAESQEVKSEF